MLEGTIGGGESALGSDDPSGVVTPIGLDALYHGTWLEVGVALSLSFAPFGESSSMAGVLAGIKIDPSPWVRLELLGEGARRTVHGIGRELFTEPIDKVSVTVPYVGGRAGLAFLLGGAHRMLLGVWFAAGHDTVQRTVTVRVRTCFLGCDESQETRAIGGANWSFLLRVGGIVSRF